MNLRVFQKTGQREITLLVFLAFLLLGSAIFSLGFGQGGLYGPKEIIQALSHRISGTVPVGSMAETYTILLYLRLPRIMLALLIGANLALSGALMQALFNNPLAEPYIVGASSGASLGAVLAVALGAQTMFCGLNLMAVAAFAGALAATFLVLAIARRAGGLASNTLLLAGVAVGGLMQAITSLLILQSAPNQTMPLLAWLMGNLAYRDWNYVFMLGPYTLLGATVAQMSWKMLNRLACGDEAAIYLGVSVVRVKVFLLVTASLLAASAVAAGGIIGFVGLMVPHAMRRLVGAHYAVLLPACLLSGGILLLWADLLARMLLSGREIPIGLVTGVLGCLFFLYLLNRDAAPIAN